MEAIFLFHQLPLPNVFIVNGLNKEQSPNEECEYPKTRLMMTNSEITTRVPEKGITNLFIIGL